MFPLTWPYVGAARIRHEPPRKRHVSVLSRFWGCTSCPDLSDEGREEDSYEYVRMIIIITLMHKTPTEKINMVSRRRRRSAWGHLQSVQRCVVVYTQLHGPSGCSVDLLREFLRFSEEQAFRARLAEIAEASSGPLTSVFSSPARLGPRLASQAAPGCAYTCALVLCSTQASSVHSCRAAVLCAA